METSDRDGGVDRRVLSNIRFDARRLARGPGSLTMGTGRNFPTACLSLSEIDLCGWLGQAEPGETLEYYRGYLGIDAIAHGSPLPEQDRAELSRIARRALWAVDRGIAYLVQRRHGPHDYSYLAIARSRPSDSQSLSELLAVEIA